MVMFISNVEVKGVTKMFQTCSKTVWKKIVQSTEVADSLDLVCGPPEIRGRQFEKLCLLECKVMLRNVVIRKTNKVKIMLHCFQLPEHNYSHL
jgi:hypothetical protein